VVPLRIAVYSQCKLACRDLLRQRELQNGTTKCRLHRGDLGRLSQNHWSGRRERRAAKGQQPARIVIDDSALRRSNEGSKRSPRWLRFMRELSVSVFVVSSEAEIRIAPLLIELA